jgi:hypothetical protein
MYESFWPEIPALEPEITPAFILGRQADFLTDKTKGLLIGDVREEGEAGTLQFIYTLRALAPAMDYRHIDIVTVAHGPDPYPLALVDVFAEKEVPCGDEDEYVRELKRILSARHVGFQLMALLKQVLSLEQSDEAPGSASGESP